ncbi:MAG: response regulator transcription factor [Bacillota bacterium]
MEKLTNRETEIIQLVASGKTNQELAEELYIAVPTVKAHLRHIFNKLGATNRTQAVCIAIRNNLINLKEV